MSKILTVSSMTTDHGGRLSLWARFSGLRFRLILMILLVVVPSLGMILYVARDRRHRELLEARAQAVQLARRAATTHERLVEDVHAVLVRLAQLPLVPTQSEVELRRTLRGFVGADSTYSALGVAAPDGRII